MTPRQRDLLAFIASYQNANSGVSPSVDEMAAALGLAGKANVVRLLDVLQERGFIHRLKGRARAIEVLRPATAGGVAPSLTFIPIGSRESGDGAPTAATDRYPFLGHMTCAEWGGRSLHGEAA